jgi:mitochondrial fission protein ELM1
MSGRWPSERAAAPAPDTSQRAASPEPARTPLVWLLLGEKPGDNAQVQVLADALGWPFETRRLLMRPEWLLGKPGVRASLEYFDQERSDPLEAPWPDLVITIGRRLSMAALWIQEASRGASRIVLLGKPRRGLARFDLVVASAQYRVPARANVLTIALPLMRVDTEAVAAATEAWRARLAGLPRPLTALLVGGPTKAVRFDEEVTRDLALRARAAAAGGSLYVCTSRRTPASLIEVLASALPDAATYRWRAEDPENPYRALLGLADRFAVTSDSITMAIEVARLGRPLAIHALPARHRALRTLTRSRDLEAVARLLVARGHAVWLGEPWPQAPTPPGDELARVVERVRALLASPLGDVAAVRGAK